MLNKTILLCIVFVISCSNAIAMKNTLSKMQIIELAKNIQVLSFDLDAFNTSMQDICITDHNIVHETCNMNDFKIDESKVQKFFQHNPQGIMIFTIVDKSKALTGLVFYNSSMVDTKIEVFYVDFSSKRIPEQINQQSSIPVHYLFRVLDTEQQGVYVPDVSTKFLIEYYRAIITDIKKLQAQSEPLEECEELLEEYEEYDSLEVYIGSSESNNEYFRNIIFLNTTKLQSKNTANLHTFGKDFFKKPDGNSTISTLISSSSETDASWYQQYLLWRDAHKYIV